MSLIKTLNIKEYVGKDNEDYMCDNQLTHFKNLLKSWKSQLISAAENTVNFLQRDSSKQSDSTDNATKEEELQERLRKQSRDSKLINRIQKCIQTIDDKSYGFCDSCGEEIGIKRLEARPVAKECIDCKTLAEEKEKVS